MRQELSEASENAARVDEVRPPAAVRCSVESHVECACAQLKHELRVSRESNAELRTMLADTKAKLLRYAPAGSEF